MNLLLYGTRGPQLSELARSLKPLNPTSVRLADTWQAVESGIAESRPDVVVLCMSQILAEDPNLAFQAQLFLIEQGMPAIVAINAGVPSERLVAQEYFPLESLVESPYQHEALRERIEVAMEKAGRMSGEHDRSFDEVWDAASARTEESNQPQSVVSPPKVTIISRFKAVPGLGRLTETNEPITTRKPGVLSGSSRDEAFDPEAAAQPRMTPLAADSRGSNSIEALFADFDRSSPGAESVVHRPGFPSLANGQIDQASPLRVLYAHTKAQSTGRLVLTRANQRREFHLLSGTPGLVDVERIEPARRDELTLSLTWNAGVYVFQAQPFDLARFTPLGDILDLMHGTIQQRLGFSDVSEALYSFVEMVPIITSRILADSGTLSRLPGVAQFLGQCRGPTLEHIASGKQASAENTLKNALFCYLIDAICFRNSPLPRPITLVYTATTPGKAAGVSLTTTGASGDETNPEEEALLTELAARATEFQDASPYRIFGLEPGCGRDAIEDVYYALVKRHHPDAYALARSPSAKPLAEMVFRRIREAFRELNSGEKTKGPSPIAPTPRPQTAVEGNVESAASGEVGDSGMARGPDGRTPPKTAQPGANLHREPSGKVLIPESDPDARPARHGSGRPHEGTANARPATGAHPKAVTQSSQAVPATHPKPAQGFGRRGATSSSRIAAVRATVTESQSIPVSLRQQFKNGLSLLASGANQKAAEAFRLAYAEEEDNGSYLAYHVWSHYLVGQIPAKEAIQTLKDGLERLEDKENLSLFLGQILLAEGQAAKALIYFNECLKYNPHNIEAGRQVRLHQRRQGKKGETILNKLLSLGGTKGKEKKS